MERRLTAGAPKREDTTTERLMREFEQRIVASPPGVCPVDMSCTDLWKMCAMPCRAWTVRKSFRGCVEQQSNIRDFTSHKGNSKEYSGDRRLCHRF